MKAARNFYLAVGVAIIFSPAYAAKKSASTRKPRCESRVLLEYPVRGYTFTKYVAGELQEKLPLDLEALNPQLKAAGLVEIPSRLLLGLESVPLHDQLSASMEKVEDIVGTTPFINFDANSNHFTELEDLVYRGAPSALPKLLDALAGNFLSGDSAILAFRHGKVRRVLDPRYFEADEDADEGEEGGAAPAPRSGSDEAIIAKFGATAPGAVDAWVNYDTNSKDFLILASQGPQGDGTELDLLIIHQAPKTKEQAMVAVEAKSSPGE